MKNILLIIIFLLSNSCLHQNDYPEIIKKNKLEKEFDEAKWIVYCSNHRGKGFQCSKDSLIYNHKTTPFSECNVNLKDLKIKKDTIFFKFTFSLDFPNKRCRTFGFGIKKIVFIKNDTIIYRGFDGYSFTKESYELQRIFEINSTNMDEVGVYPLKIERKLFEKYLKETDDELNPWLRREAIKRGIIER